ncbi:MULTISPECIES: YccF domain-containing protein [unclassified Dysgonomonas]|uniref:YccF domain-containing protein n=1 Tax=unclassified Dysgonomonas TaxID=2630389 RepID=UPI002475854C|nr:MULTISPECIES: YccF domain-containing protein [unclassified Dysgonomonas]
MKTIGNIIWLVFGGWLIALEYFFASVGLMVTIVGIPFGLQSIKLGVLALWPFGSRVSTVEESSGCLNLAMNIIWIFIGGFWIALTHLALGVLFCLTIVCIPFGLQHFKFMKLAFLPFGKQIEQA